MRMAKPAGMGDTEWNMRCDLAAASRLAVRLGFNAGPDKDFGPATPDSEDRFEVRGGGSAMPGAASSTARNRMTRAGRERRHG
jgi:hypothetical protein